MNRNTLLIALREIRRNLMRSFLTILGIVIGVAAVITMVTLGNGATRAVAAQVASLGSNLIMIRPGQRLGPGQGSAGAPSFKLADVNAIKAQIPGLAAVAPIASTMVTVVAGANNWSTTVQGTSDQWFMARDWTLAAGRTFYEGEERAGAAVCVIGERVRKELFGSQNPIGSSIRVKQFACNVIGLLKAKGQSGMGQDQDDVVVMPLRTVQRRLTGSLDVGTLIVSVKDGVSTGKVQNQLQLLLRERRHIAANENDNFNVMDTKQIAEALSGTTNVLTTLLGAVAAVSLLVGGIGIMNIMLVSVTERTREIGIRLAIGALEREVLLQFLIEAVVLSSLGGLIGIAIATAASIFLAGVMQVPYVFNLGINVLSFAFSAAIGVVFGYFPARRAARLDPIEALRHE
ncbi:multidrug ABC transporter substrate-binding protein [Pandoraea thiooxydans]|uniref:Multidrug ABC transporter substrate-binding protein n=1 Tax=Pandoraea thiooxydans TaxID=445709 RepID=A0A0G3ER06_9BURK|nr:ABC transporter permease [Pandoraea thiooxydans]AKJ68434.1 multidrug ABC transporter substrate-binding protein [Pandoraea thiooxydans]APR95802.1 multidrug ABC transporter substrate-binding protein [Pandoraea thiooxydans]